MPGKNDITAEILYDDHPTGKHVVGIQGKNLA